MKILGIMSGSSLDGIDLALCEFEDLKDGGISWEMTKAATVPYSDEWIARLKSLPNVDAREITLVDYELGYLFGKVSKDFLKGEKIDFIASHGHTIFHEPQNKMTLQIANGSAIASSSGISTIYDFRSMDIGFGGQGAPIVAILDRDIFGEYDALVNLGGISNISFMKDNKTVAYDISPCNQLLNYLANKKGLEYDKDGAIASNGTVNEELFRKLKSFEYFLAPFPKSLDNNFIKKNFIPILDNDDSNLQDKMATIVELIAKTIADELEMNLSNMRKKPKIMFAGGGTNNSFLMNRIIALSQNATIIIPDKKIIDYKEALLMAYLGYLRAKEKPNVLSSVTGAQKDSIGGAICLSRDKGL